MRIDIITLFPEMFQGPFDQSMVKRAINQRAVDIALHQLRDAAQDKHHAVDDRPYGGGAGMVLKVDVIDRAIEKVIAAGQAALGVKDRPWIILLTPQGQKLTQAVARELSQRPWLGLICGHYEGFDERVRSVADQELSIGDYVLTGGELPAMVIVDAITRLLPGVLQVESPTTESHEQTLLEYPQYTRPAVYKGMAVPEALLTGNHQAIADWRAAQAQQRTKERRPDLLSEAHNERSELMNEVHEERSDSIDKSTTLG